MKNPQENLIQDKTSPEKIGKGFGVEIPADEARKITGELSRINDLINHDGVIKVEDLDNLSSVAKETKIDVGGEIMTVEEAEKIPDLKMNMEIWKEMSEGNFGNVPKLTRITKKVSKFLEKIDGSISLSSLKSAHELILPETIGGSLLLNSLTSAHELVLPQTIGGDICLPNLTSAHELALPETIGRSLYLNNLTSAHELVLPKTIGGNLSLEGLTSAHELVLPETIGGNLLLNSLTSAHELILPETIGRNLYLDSLTSEDKQRLKEQYPQFADKII